MGNCSVWEQDQWIKQRFNSNLLIIDKVPADIGDVYIHLNVAGVLSSRGIDNYKLMA